MRGAALPPGACSPGAASLPQRRAGADYTSRRTPRGRRRRSGVAFPVPGCCSGEAGGAAGRCAARRSSSFFTMSEISSDSDSSCGWTVINHEGSDVEAAAPDSDSISGHEELASEERLSPTQVEDQQQVDFGQGDGAPVSATSQSPTEPSKLVPGDEKEKMLDETSCVGGVSDDSDIVTLEVPKVEEVGSQEEAASGEEEGPASENFNMGSSSSSQYTFCQPETAFPLQPSGEESSSDETSHGSSPTLRRRRAKKRLLSSSESEEGPPPPDPEVKQAKHLLSSGLNRCIILALVIAVSMGFGHFYGTVQIQKQQELVEKTHEDKLNDMKGDLLQCQQGSKTPCGSLKEGLAKCWLATQTEKESFESQKFRLASENQHLRESLQREEKALALLQEELRKLREEVRHLESRGPGPESLVVTENQKLRAHLEEERHRMQSFVKQKETLLAEAQMLRRELDKERQVTVALRETLGKLNARHGPLAAEAGSHKGQETETLRGMLAELEKKLSFEQQRSDLWEKLYVEVKDRAEKQERAEKAQKKPAGKGGSPNRAKAKATFFGSVKETFDAMKNSTKEFVRHHKEKIKQAKEAVKENLRKFSDSVKSTFRHFKDTTRNIFDGREKKRYSDRRHETNRKGRMMHQTDGSRDGPVKPAQHQAPGSQRHFGQRTPRPEDPQPFSPLSTDGASGQCPRGPTGSPKQHAILKGCSGIFDCAHQEFISLFNKVLDPIRADEFNQLMHKYLQQEVKNFHHWRELEIFTSSFFRNGVFIHDQMLFSDFVNDVKDYLEDMEEYQRASDGAFEGLDKYIYQYYFHHYNQMPPPRGSSPQQERPLPKHQQRSKKESRWQKQGRNNGRHTANLEIEVGRLPFDPKY
ncbi:cell cycle progression protein 1 isoform X2 [Thamnophis elegans]|uniref:cell cycle progression protein 1 isoform X2 n=1 Tax=Thamnophis elegans TaxID=35005 RepID=UPI001376C246|nr:cell cycle progression protein 1 isoform X2 [Thamnophis elegans]